MDSTEAILIPGRWSKIWFAGVRVLGRVLRRFAKQLRRSRYRIERESPRLSQIVFPIHYLLFLLIRFYVLASRSRWNQIELLFIHIPKTGGSTMNQVLRQFGLVEVRSLYSLWQQIRLGPREGPRILTLNHIEPDLLIRIGLCTRETLETASSFAVLRNPYYRTWSAYRHLTRVPGRRLKTGVLLSELISLMHRHTYRTRLDKSFGPSHASPQSQWIKSDLWDGPKHIFNLEKPEEIEAFLSEFFSQPVRLHQANVGIGSPELPVPFPCTAKFLSVYADDFQYGHYSSRLPEKR